MSSTIAAPLTHEGEPVKGSRFLCQVAPVTTEQGAQMLLADARLEHPGAAHHCSAWRLAAPAIERCSDDGEPGGSAGRPMLARLQGRDLLDIAVVVIRYFGGTKLGVGGLIRAYGGAVGQALDHCDLVPHVELATATITHGYDDASAVEAALRAAGVTSATVTYGALVERVVQIAAVDRARLEDAMRDATAGRLTPTWR